jgi:hypothetical protein
MRRSPRLLVLPVVFAFGLGVGACGGDDADDDPVGTTTGPATSVSTTAEPSTTSTSPATTPTTSGPATTAAPPSTGGPTTTGAAFQPGQPCPLGSDPDCIDPSGTGEGVYLVGGADCMAGGYPEICIDLDGDGRAGYPDRS